MVVVDVGVKRVPKFNIHIQNNQLTNVVAETVTITYQFQW